MIKSAMLRFDKLLGETPKAYLIKICNQQHWIPKSLCKSFITNKKLGGNVVLPTFLIDRMLEIDINAACPSFITPTWIVEKHTPDKINPVESNHIQELKK
jgi:hypothetical protein